jgi:hypothetical protein
MSQVATTRPSPMFDWSRDLSPFTIFSGGNNLGPIWVALPAPPSPFVRLATTTSETMPVSFSIFAYRPN